jgi:hypothetical protein
MDDFLNSSLEMIAKINAIMDQNRDDSKMEIGDRVVPWDGSSLTEINGDDICLLDEPFISAKYFVVISNSEKVISVPIRNEYLQDLIIVHPETNQKFRISSEMVKHFIL